MWKIWTEPLNCPVRKKRIGKTYCFGNGKVIYTADVRDYTVRFSKSKCFEKIVTVEHGSSGETTRVVPFREYVWTKLLKYRTPPAHLRPTEADDDED